MFCDPRHAAEGLRDYGVSMEMTPREPDMESMLKASGWETTPRRGASPTKERMFAVKKMLDAIKTHEEGDEEEEEEVDSDAEEEVMRGKMKRMKRSCEGR